MKKEKQYAIIELYQKTTIYSVLEWSRLEMETARLANIYKIIESSRVKYGTLKKCEFHIHTPASFDYRLIPGKKYSTLTINEVVDIALSQGYLDEDSKAILDQKIIAGEYEGEEYKKSLSDQDIPYDSLKEYLAYQLIAHKLYGESVEVAVISDHNTIEGFFKLKFALVEYFQRIIKVSGINKRPIHLFLGIEISCSEQNHLVGIFDENKYEQLNRLIDDFIFSKEQGTYETSYNMIEKIIALNGIPYIAHINTSDFIGTGIYKETLYGSDNLNVLGLTNLSRKSFVLETLSNFTNKTSRFCFIHEGDSHELTTLGKRNTWIKFSKISFQALKKAVKNHHFCIYSEEPFLTNKYIKGIIVEPGKEGFLRSRPGQLDDRFYLDFSKDLNCIIGGRGTGKSTILNMLETIFTLESKTVDSLKFISKHKIVYVVFHLKGNDYIIKFIPQSSSDRDYYEIDDFAPRAFKNKNPEKLFLSDHWLELYEVTANSDIIDFQLITENRNIILNDIFRNGYSINNIINSIDRGEIGLFVKEVIFNGLIFEDFKSFINKINHTPKSKFNKFIKENFHQLVNIIERRKLHVDEAIKEFNFINQNLINIHYSPKEKHIDYYLSYLFDDIQDKTNRILKTKLKWHDAERFIYESVKKIGFLELINLLLNDKVFEIEKQNKLSNYISTPTTLREIESGWEDISVANIKQVYREIKNKLLSKNINAFETTLVRYFEVIDDFTLSFNVNSKESVSEQACLMKNIVELSLGQKVVAILTFLFNYGKYSNDNSPLIIDQPEDNLDNQYIYKNLVASLREMKNSRQVILVTHSSTIVTNADSEQVIVLNSNNEVGWIEQKGYPSDEKIMKYIITYLEGGEPSFKHKMDMYSIVLNA